MFAGMSLATALCSSTTEAVEVTYSGTRRMAERIEPSDPTTFPEVDRIPAMFEGISAAAPSACPAKVPDLVGDNREALAETRVAADLKIAAPQRLPEPLVDVAVAFARRDEQAVMPAPDRGEPASHCRQEALVRRNDRSIIFDPDHRLRSFYRSQSHSTLKRRFR